MNENSKEDQISEKPSVKYDNVKDAARIYLLPNFFTAGNMCCGFLSLCQCIEAKYSDTVAAANEKYMMAVYLIFGACIFRTFSITLTTISKSII